MSEESIGDLLNGTVPEPVEAPPAVETPTEATTEPVETTERPRGPDGKFIPKGDKEPVEPVASATPAPLEETGNIPIAALKDERSKRQAIEQERDQLRQQLAQYQQPQAQPQAQVVGPPDRWDDPEGYDRWLVGQASQAAREEAIQAYTFQRIQTDAAQFRADKPDYDEAIGLFGRMAETNPGLIEQMQQAPSPAKFAYDTGKLQAEITQHGGIDGLVEARLKAREAAALTGLQAQLPQSAPPTISNDRSVGARSGPAWSGPGSLSDYLK